MKKKLVLLLAGLLAVSMLGGCGKEENAGGESQIQTESSSEGTNATGTENTGEEQEPVEAILLKDVAVEEYVTLGEYKGLEISFAEKGSFTQEEVDELAFSVYQDFVTAEAGGVTDRAAENGDTVNISYVGKKDGVAFEGGTADNQALELGSGSYIDGFEEGLVGVKPGETVDLNLTFPDPYNPNPDLAGKPVVFTVTVNFIYPTEPAQMVDEVVATMGSENYTNVAELKEFCTKYLEYQTEMEYEAGRQDAALMALMAVAEVQPAPEGLIERYYRSIYDTLVRQAGQYGLDADTYCSYYFGMDAVSYANEYAKESAKQSMVVQHIANLENLNITDEELEVRLQEFAEKNETTVEEIRSGDDDEMLKEYFMFENVLNFLIENGVVTEIEE